MRIFLSLSGTKRCTTILGHNDIKVRICIACAKILKLCICRTI